MGRLVPIALIVALTGGCSAVKDEGAAQQAVVRFHQMLDAGQFDAIYDGSAPKMKVAATKATFVQLMDAIHRKLGVVKEAKQQGWNVNYMNGVGTITLSYQTQFASGSGAEQFVYRTGDRPLLIGYNINSTDLMIK